MCLNLTNGSDVTIIKSCQCGWKFLFEPNEETDRLRNLILEEPKPKETMNIKVIGDFINSLKRVETWNFDIGRMKLEGLKLKGFLSYDFELEPIFKFLLVFMMCFLMQYEGMMALQHVGPICSSPKEKLAKYIRCTYSWWRITLIPVVSSNETSLRNRS
jgi:hypothetical protein